MKDTSIKRPLKALLEEGLQKEVFTAAQGSWCRRDEIPNVVCAGTTLCGPVIPDTQFDIASLTKLFTAAACLRFVAAGELDLESPLGSLPGGPVGGLLSGASLAQLLAHEAGFAAYLPLFESVAVADRGSAEARDHLFRGAAGAPAASPPGTRLEYSDLGFIVLARILEAQTGKGLPEVIAEQVCAPLRLTSTTFRGIDGSEPLQESGIAPTEHCPWRRRVLEGEVHDDNAWTMGGVSGHAGLFSTARDMTTLGATWLRCLRGEDSWLPRDLAVVATTRRPLGRGLGFDFKSGERPAAGDRMGRRSFGHLGFTGCSLWVDPERELAVTLLTNRIHLGRENHRIRELRPRFHDLIAAAIEK